MAKRSSTDADAGPALPHAWSFAKLTPAELTRTWQVPAARAAAIHAELIARHGDPAWVTDVLGRIPAPGLVVLAVIADAGGMIDERALLTTAEYEYDMPGDAVRGVLRVLFGEVLIVPLTGRWGEAAFALIEPSARRIAAALADLQLPIVPPGELPAGPADDGRVMLAACTALAHVDVKLTLEGGPHRGALKRYAKAWGLPEKYLEMAWLAGHRAGALVPDDEHDALLRPDLAALHALATQADDGTPIAALRAELARAGKPVASAAVHRWMLTAPAAARVHELDPLMPELAGWLPGLRAGLLGGVSVLAAEPAPAGDAAASVTPSFEVFLPPESRPEHVVAVLACCELTRIDRAIVGRITKASIARAVAAGQTRAQILAALAGASRTPLPQNVEAAIADWAAGTAAVVATGRVVVVPPADGDRVRAALGALVTHVLAPGVFLVEPDASARALSVALGKIGVTTVGAGLGVAAAPGPRAPAAAIPRLPTGSRSTAARARLEAWRRGDPAERALVAPGAPGALGPAAPADDAIGAAIAAWETRGQARLDELQLRIFRTALEVLPADLGSRLLASRTVAALERELMALAKSGVLREAMAAAADAPAPRPAAAAPLHPLDDPSLVWHTDDLRARLERAAAQERRVAIETPKHVHVVVPARVIQRGAAWIVLGVDDHDNDLAIPLKIVVAVAELDPPAAQA